MNEQVLVAGFGGQGVLLIGQIMSQAGMTSGKHVSWLPAYGPEMRGGTASCSVILSDEPVGSPMVTDPTSLLVLNRPSYDKFEPTVAKGGCIIVNASLVEAKSTREDIRKLYVPCNAIAAELGNDRVINMIMLGAFIEATHILTPEQIIEALRTLWGPSREKLIPVNQQALERGAACVREQS